MKNTKKILSLALAAMLLALSLLCFASCGEAKGPFVYVSVADENGNLVAMYEKVEYTEGLTIDAALAALHEKKCAGGYASEESVYGLSLSKLWGVENGGSYGYYVNNASPSSLSDTLKEGDHVYAFVYTDTVMYSDTFSFFSATAVEAERGAELSLTLFSAGYDESWNPVTLPVCGAKILIDGDETNLTTDENGSFSTKFDKKGTYTITVSYAEANLTPAFVIVTVK